MSNYTPGPWAVSISGSFETEVRSASGRRIAATWVQGPAKSREGALNQGRVNEANARLIAAAPDLLQCLKDCREELVTLERQSTFGIGSTSALIAINSATGIIAKVEGVE